MDAEGRAVDVRFLDLDAKIEKISGDKVKQAITLRQGIDTVLAKRIVQLIKDSRLKCSAAIQGDAVRVSGAKRDALQEVIALVRKEITEMPLAFENFRD